MWNPLNAAGKAAAGVVSSVLGSGPGSLGDIASGGAATQGAAAQAAAAQQAALIQQQMAAQQAATNQAVQTLQQGQNSAGDYIAYGGQQAQDALSQGYGQAEGALGTGYDTSIGQLYGGQDQAAGAIQGGVDAAGQTLAPGMAYQQQGQALADMLASGPYANFTQDPGYAFRLKQGQDAISAQASAMGGRHGGDTLKALNEYNQNFASNEFGNYVNRQNSIMAQMYGLAGMGANAAGQYAGMQGAAGQDLGNLYQSTGQGAAGLSQQYGQDLGNMYAGAGNAAAGQYNQTGNAMASNFQWGANAQANALTGGAAGQWGMANALGQTYGAGVPYAGYQQAGAQNLIMGGLSAYFGAPHATAGPAGNGDMAGGAPGSYQDPYGNMY